MTNKHTPGPWSLFNDDKCVAGPESTVGAGQGVAMCSMRARSDEEARANAQLIAAAPDLLDALQHLSSVYDNIWVKMSDGEMAIVKGAWEVAAAAIAKAEGRS